ncbi:Actin depolymerizing protein [Venustampulla echinocandica]|uniref:Actin depolymerizing protein n=1 Tax=Venustampulla echinocandica TaxID=2656787 RepID=A0A370TRV9_9HELO|nr:Actin depolymerizing protein [Venustampulla echinocandica]RDL38234.1 Actin depolymerizing protein [Venustampulla echinocandica]
MASLNTSTNGPSIKSSYNGVVNSPPPSGPAASSPTYGQWALFSVSAPLVNAFQQDSGGKESVLKVQSTGEGELVDLIEDFSEGRVQFAFVKVKDSNTTLPKYVLIGWCGEGVPERTKGYFTSHLAAVSKILHGYHVQITARSDRDLTPEGIVQKVADASGAKYSAPNNPPSASSGPPPPIASKPAFNPTRSSVATSGFNPLASSRSSPGQNDTNVDEDGWGADAPQVTRSQLEKVAPAYKPTKVNMAELTKQKPEPVGFNGQRREESTESSDVVKGGYQPIGKVDIAAIRAQSKKTEDNRPTIVKGAYEPVGKVDIAAIRARAQKPGDDGSSRLSPAVTGVSATSHSSDESKPLADRTAVFSQSERLTSLPKPKVANKFGSGTSNFTGTKPPTPGVYGLRSPPATATPPPVGAASRTFADEGGKTPAQIWAEKKARETGTGGAGSAATVPSAITSQTSGGGEWKSGYSGKSWAPVATTTTGTSSIGQQRTGEQDEQEEREAPASPAGGIGALRDRFKGGVPMGAPTIPRSTTGDQSPPPPPINTSNRPTGGVAMPGLPSRPEPEEEEEEVRSMPPPPARAPRSPTPPTPERETSPVRIAMPVPRIKEPEFERHEQRTPSPPLPTESISRRVPDEEDLTEEPAGHDPARGAGAAVAEASFGSHAGTDQGAPAGGKRALIQYDYEKAEDNELELIEGDYVTNIEMVDEDWWMGTNSKGESGLFPSNYVELVEEEEKRAPAPAPVPAAPAAAPSSAPSGPTATAVYDYEAAEDNELSFDEGAKITGLEFPDEDWWFGHHGGKSGLFPSNYVQLDE